MLPFVLMAQVAVAQPPVITLDEALRRAQRLDPQYVAARGQVDNAEWVRRSAWSAMMFPAISVSSDASRFSTPTFNLGTGTLQDVAVSARLDARYELFTGGRKYSELGRAAAELEAARADEVAAGFESALRTESDYFNVLASQELARVGRERVARAEEQLGVARARVISGSALSTDSLQLLLEVSNARVELLRLEASLRVARLQLGRRVGMDGPVQAAPIDTTLQPALPEALDALVVEAQRRAPSVVAARAAEESAEAAVRANRGSFLPQLALGASTAAYDNTFFPTGTTRSQWYVQASLPLWNNGQRETLLAIASTSRQVARAVRRDAERALERDVTEMYASYETSRAATAASENALVIAREIFRVQQTRYRAGAATIEELLNAQFFLVEAEASLVRARYTNRLALADLEARVGRRLFTSRDLP